MCGGATLCLKSRKRCHKNALGCLVEKKALGGSRQCLHFYSGACPDIASMGGKKAGLRYETRNLAICRICITLFNHIRCFRSECGCKNAVGCCEHSAMDSIGVGAVGHLCGNAKRHFLLR